MKNYNSRTADKFVIRMPDGMRDRVSDQSAAAYLSMNSFILQAIDEKLKRDELNRNEVKK